MTKPKLRIGLIGTGFMGKAPVFGFTSAPRVFERPYELELHTVADITDAAAARAAQTLGFAHATSDWRTIIANPEIDLVSITAPNALHKEMSLAAIAAGKHVYCEKPLAPFGLRRAGDDLGRRGEGRENPGRLQLPVQPDDGPAAPDDCGGRVGRDPRLPRHPLRGLHGRSFRPLYLSP